MKKKLAVLMAASMLAVSLVGCGGSKTDAPAADGTAAGTEAEAAGDGGDLVFAWWGNQVRNERTQQMLELYSEQNPGVTFDGQFSEWNDYWKKLSTAAAGNSLPDIVQMDLKYINQYVKNGLLVDLTPYIEDGTIDVSNCNESVLNAGKVGDGIYAICNGINAPGLLYNKTVTDAAGVTIKDGMTLDEFIDISRTIHEKTGYKTNILYTSNEIFCEYLLRSKGIVMYGDGALGGTAEDYADYFALYRQGLDEGWLCEPAVFAERTIGSVEQDPLVYGSSPDTRSWCMFQYTNQLTAARNAAPEGDEIALSTWPTPDLEKSNYLKPSQFFAITTQGSNPDECAKVLDFITNSVDANNILLGERGIPLSSEVADAISPQMDETSQEIIKFINEVVSPKCSQVNPPQPDGYAEANEVLNRMEEKVAYGELTPEEAGKVFFEEANAALAAKKQ